MTGSSNSFTTGRDQFYAGSVIICINDHMLHDKINYLTRYVVLDVESDGQGRFLVKITDRQQNQHWIDSIRFMPASKYDELCGDTPMHADETAHVDNLTDSPIMRNLIAEGKAPNPKAGMGDKKPSLTLCPLSAQIAQEAAQRDGMLKYGWVNWREVRIQPQTYIDAAMRHLRLYENGEEYARDTGVSNLGAVMACCAIIIDSAVHGTLDDNRKHSPQSCDILHEAEAMVLKLKGMQEQREAKNG